MTRLSTRGVAVGPATDTAFREEFVQLLAQLGLNRATSVELAQALTNRPFNCCGRPDLLPVLDAVLKLAQHSAHFTPEPACRV